MKLLLILISFSLIKANFLDLIGLGRFFEGNLQKMMTLFQTPNDEFDQEDEEYDFVVVGAGPAGSALAARLAQHDSSWKVLLIEAGYKPSLATEVPAFVAFTQFSDYNWKFFAQKQDNFCTGCNKDQMAFHQGKGLGGTSIINYMLAVRGARSDFDSWGALNPGWSFEDILEIFKKLEETQVESQDTPFRGQGGPVTVSDVSYRSESAHAFVKAGQEAGYVLRDYNGAHQLNSVSYIQATIRDGLRCNAEKAYLRDSKLSNLKILTGSFVTKILFDSTKTATGVEYLSKGSKHVARARKEVIVSGGSFNSPKLLMLSGIGPEDRLNELSIPVLSNLPVGKKIYDHLCSFALIFTVNSSITIQFQETVSPITFADFLLRREGGLTSCGGIEAAAYFRTGQAPDQEDLANFELLYVGLHLGFDYGLYAYKSFNIKESTYEAFLKPLSGKSAFTTVLMLMHPKSFGNMTIASGDPLEDPVIYGGYLTDPQNSDEDAFVEAVRETQRIVKHPALQKYGAELYQTPVPTCKQYDFDSDDYWRCAVRHLGLTLWHNMGACRMGPDDDEMAIVDHQLKVKGVKNLRVADISVIPVTLSAHTQIIAYAIGEKAAQLIIQQN